MLSVQKSGFKVPHSRSKSSSHPRPHKAREQLAYLADLQQRFGEAVVRVQDIARDLEISERQVQRRTVELEAAGLVTRERRFDGRREVASRYVVHVQPGGAL